MSKLDYIKWADEARRYYWFVYTDGTRLMEPLGTSVRGEELDAYLAEGREILPPDPVPPVPPTYSKWRLFKAMTDAEYTTFQSWETKQSGRKQRVFKESTLLDKAEPDFAEFEGLLKMAYGEARAASLLAAAKT